MKNIKLEWVTAIFFFAAVWVYFVSPIADVDFPWHLKTGEYIYQHREIPKTDPFSLVSVGDARERFILSQYWLGQLMFYGVYDFAGPIGIIFLRSIIFCSVIVVIWFAMKNAPLLVKCGILYFVAAAFRPYAADRPQMFSFLLAAVLIAMIEKYRRSPSTKSLIFLPLIMWFWANVHGGYIFGDVVIAVVCLCETVKYFFIREKMPHLDRDRLLVLLVIGFISILISYLNPNGYQAFAITIEGKDDPLFKVIREYASALAETRGSYADSSIFIYWAIMGYSLVLLALNLRRLDLTHVGVIVFTMYISLSAIRFVPFFILAALIVSGPYRFNIIEFEKFRLFKKLKLPAAAASLLLVLFWGGSLVYSMPRVSALSTISETSAYAVRAAQFLLREADGGKVFCSYNSGSYLLWKLYPKYRTFVDTRGINYHAIFEAQSISYAERWDDDNYSLEDALKEILPKDFGKVDVDPGKRPSKLPEKEKWASLLDKYEIDFIVHEATNLYTGRMYALALRLIKDDRWKLVYLDGRRLIFVRDIPRYKGLIARHELKKERVYDEIGMESIKRTAWSLSSVYSSLAFALLMKGGPEKSIEEFLGHALYLDPKDRQSAYIDAFLKLKRQKG